MQGSGGPAGVMGELRAAVELNARTGPGFRIGGLAATEFCPEHGAILGGPLGRRIRKDDQQPFRRAAPPAAAPHSPTQRQACAGWGRMPWMPAMSLLQRESLTSPSAREAHLSTPALQPLQSDGGVLSERSRGLRALAR
jgi:hypothetical protein